MKRIIPARAGFTVHASRASDLRADHPRSRGVYETSKCSAAAFAGSSPLARGLLTTTHGKREKTGIIPARAGFTPTTSWRSAGRWDHPRSRGVYRENEADRAGLPGSSPLARGLPIAIFEAMAEHGIIPARAGFTLARSASLGTTPDHPRSRGVYNASNGALYDGNGSSPLARGLQKALAERRVERGIIPARAGFTHGVGRSLLPCTDHPRSRGVYSPIISSFARAAGSSPLARGLPLSQCSIMGT